MSGRRRAALAVTDGDLERPRDLGHLEVQSVVAGILLLLQTGLSDYAVRRRGRARGELLFRRRTYLERSWLDELRRRVGRTRRPGGPFVGSALSRRRRRPAPLSSLRGALATKQPRG